MHSLRPLGLLLAALLGSAACGDDSTATSESAGESTASTSVDETTTSTSGSTTSTSASTSASGSGSESGGETGVALCEPPAKVADRGLLLRDDPRVDNGIDPCGADRWYLVAASETTYELTISAKVGGVTAAIAYPDVDDVDAWVDPLVPLTLASGETSVAELKAPRSGEFALHVAPAIAEDGATYDLKLRCTAGCTRETTRFPLVFVHGWTGFESIGPLEYFYQIQDTLDPLGYPTSIAVLDPYNSSEVRGTQLAAEIDGFLAEWRARKVDLVGHSQGGIDSRYAISTLGYGPQVSVLLTIGSPHRGSYITDLALGLAPGAVEVALAGLLNFVGAVTAQEKSDALASFESLSEAHMEGEFNPQNPDDPAVEYVSYTGRTCAAVDFINPDNQCEDLVDPLLGWSYDILKLARGANDGLVPIASAQWGDYRGEMIADHIDEVGQIAGITDDAFDHRDWYLARVRDLVGDGH